MSRESEVCYCIWKLYDYLVIAYQDLPVVLCCLLLTESQKESIARLQFYGMYTVYDNFYSPDKF